MKSETTRPTDHDISDRGGGMASPDEPLGVSPLAAARAKCRGGFAAVGLFSMLLNVLMLAAPLYMLQVFDRVLSSRSIDTLIFLTLAVVMALFALAGLEAVRSRILAEIGEWLERTLSPALLAHALYGDPKLVVLDEPNASLDTAGDQALIRAMRTLAENKVTTIIIAHRPSVLKHIDHSLVMHPGAAPEFGPCEEMFKSVSALAPVARVVGGTS